MLQHERRPVPNIIQVIDWCQNDEFWSVNILSMEKLRKHFDRLELVEVKGSSYRRLKAE
jgi:hypothetical protein